MIAYVYRTYNYEKKEPAGWVGFAVAQDIEKMFWAIDQFVDPYKVQVKTLYHFSSCAELKRYEKCGEDESELVNVTFGESYPCVFDEDGWKAPIWIKKEN